jgi:glycosyltransferase involved in cell wall biosynthesis
VRILVVSNLFPPIARGGYERECAGVVEHLREQHEVLVLTSRLGRTRATGGDPTVQRSLPFLSEDAKGSLRAPMATLVAAAGMRQTLASFRPDLVWCWNGSQIPHAIMRIAHDAGIPIAYRVCEQWFGGLFVRDQFMRHLQPGDSGLRRVWAAGMRALNQLPVLRLEPSRRAVAAISWVSEATRQLAGLPSGVEAIHEEVVYPALPTLARFAGVERRPSDEPTVLFLGRVEPYKGPQTLVRALRVLREEHRVPARLLLAGPSEQKELRSLRALAEAEGVPAAVEFRGQLDPDDVADLLATAHVLAVPSIWPEPFPLVMLEGAAAGIPIIAARVGGIPEFAHDGDRALLFPPGDAAACARALAATLLQPEDSAARAARAKRAAAGFSWEAYLAASDRFLEAAMAAFARSPQGALR